MTACSPASPVRRTTARGGGLVGLRTAAPQTDLQTVVAAHLIGHQPDERDTTAQPTRAVGPAFELPARPLDDRRRRQAVVAVPRPLAALAVLGLDQDHHPGAHPPVGGEPGDEIVGEPLHHEHDCLELLDGFVERMLDPPSGMGVDRRGRTQIATAGQPVGVQADRAEPRQHVACVERRQTTERADAEPHEQVDQLGIDLAHLAQPADRQRCDEVG